MFRAKHFTVFHQKSSMKVGSDAVLIACWANVQHANAILDIGTGCGIIALILAQRNSKATIHAIDIDKDSIDEAELNFNASAWHNRLFAEQIRVQDLTKTGKLYDFIITNPPYFVNSLKADRNQRKEARHADVALPFDELLFSVYKILLPEGRFICILPPAEANLLFREAEAMGLYCVRMAKVDTVENGNLQRHLMEFSKQKTDCVEEEQFYIMDQSKKYSSHYKELTKDFYLGLE